MSASSGERLRVEDVGDVTVVRFTVPRLMTEEDTEATFSKLYDLVENSGRRKFVLDLAAVESFASAALGKLVALNRKARAANARMVLCRPTQPVQRVLQLTRLNDVLISYDDEDEACRSMG
jgi:anti-anti-sigma factor